MAPGGRSVARRMPMKTSRVQSQPPAERPSASRSPVASSSTNTRRWRRSPWARSPLAAMRGGVEMRRRQALHPEVVQRPVARMLSGGGRARPSGCVVEVAPARSCCARSNASARARSGRQSSSSPASPGAADDDLVLFDRDLDGAVAGPVLGVDGVVGDGGVEPQPVALLAVVEACPRAASGGRRGARARDRRGARGGSALPGRRRRPRRRRSAPRAAASSPRSASAASSARAPRRPRARRRSARRPRRAGRSRRRSRSSAPSPFSASSGASSFSRLKVSICWTVDLELVGDPRVGAALADPAADLIEMWAQRATCHGARDPTRSAPGDHRLSWRRRATSSPLLPCAGERD